MFKLVCFCLFLIFSVIRTDFEVCVKSKRYTCSMEKSLEKILNRSDLIDVKIMGNDKDNLSFSVPFSTKWCNVRKLSIENFSLLSVPVGMFGNLMNLSDLSLDFLKLKNNDLLDGEVFKGNQTKIGFYALPNLMRLSLRNNLLTGLESDFFLHIRHIRLLILAENPLKMLTDSTIKALHSLQNLENLDLSWTMLMKIPSNFLHAFPHLNTLNLSLNYFTGFPKAVEKASNLSTLIMSFNPITYLNSDVQMLNLKLLHLINLKISSIDGHFFKNLPNLEALYLDNNIVLKNIHPNAFSFNNKLKFMSVRGCGNLTTLNLINSTLKEVDFQFSDILCVCENNQWILNNVFPKMVKNNVSYVKKLKCKKPYFDTEVEIYDYYVKNHTFPCVIDYLLQIDSKLAFLVLFATITLIYVTVFCYLVIRSKFYTKCIRKRSSLHYVKLRNFQ